MHGEAYKQSAIIARDHGGPFAEYKVNEAPFSLRVIGKHRDAAYLIPTQGVPATQSTTTRLRSRGARSSGKHAQRAGHRARAHRQ